MSAFSRWSDAKRPVPLGTNHVFDLADMLLEPIENDDETDNSATAEDQMKPYLTTEAIQKPNHFDSVMSLHDQERWLTNSTYIDRDGERQLTHPHGDCAERFQSLIKMPHFDDVLKVARAYVQTCIPAYVRSEQTYWEVTAKPVQATDVLLRVNVGAQLSFDVVQDETGFIFRWWLLREQVEQLFGVALDQLDAAGEDFALTLFGGHEIEISALPSDLVKGGDDQIMIAVFSAEDALALLTDEIMISSARESLST